MTDFIENIVNYLGGLFGFGPNSYGSTNQSYDVTVISENKNTVTPVFNGVPSSAPVSAPVSAPASTLQMNYVPSTSSGNLVIMPTNTPSTANFDNSSSTLSYNSGSYNSSAQSPYVSPLLAPAFLSIPSSVQYSPSGNTYLQNYGISSINGSSITSPSSNGSSTGGGGGGGSGGNLDGGNVNPIFNSPSSIPAQAPSSVASSSIYPPETEIVTTINTPDIHIGSRKLDDGRLFMWPAFTNGVAIFDPNTNNYTKIADLGKNIPTNPNLAITVNDLTQNNNNFDPISFERLLLSVPKYKAALVTSQYIKGNSNDYNIEKFVSKSDEDELRLLTTGDAFSLMTPKQAADILFLLSPPEQTLILNNMNSQKSAIVTDILKSMSSNIYPPSAPLIPSTPIPANPTPKNSNPVINPSATPSNPMFNGPSSNPPTIMPSFYSTPSITPVISPSISSQSPSSSSPPAPPHPVTPSSSPSSSGNILDNGFSRFPSPYSASGPLSYNPSPPVVRTASYGVSTYSNSPSTYNQDLPQQIGKTINAFMQNENLNEIDINIRIKPQYGQDSSSRVDRITSPSSSSSSSPSPSK